ncbi:MAG: 50S ribosomal protein L6 [Nanoarchaeota archaeon]|nr:50S ribosomal protein L6 [Nanoarchaeota archaeon]
MTSPKGLETRIPLRQGQTASFSQNVLRIKGKKGEVSREIAHPMLGVSVENGEIVMNTQRPTKNFKRMLYTHDAHVRNLVRGADEGHVYTLKICASHFPMTVQVSGTQFIVKNFLGEKFPRTLNLKAGAAVKVEGLIITVESADKETAGIVASDIEKLMRRPGFDPRIFQDGIYITSKDGKGVSE